MDMCNGAWLLERVVCLVSLVEMFMGFVFFASGINKETSANHKNRVLVEPWAQAEPFRNLNCSNNNDSESLPITPCILFSYII